MATKDDDFRVRPGRIRHGGGARAKSFISQVLKAARTAGPVASYYAGGRCAPGLGRSSFGRGQNRFGRSRLFSPARRVVVKTRIVRHRGTFRSAPLSVHLSYLKREGVTRDGEKARMFDAGSDQADETAFADRCKDDRHHFRFIISPEDACEMADLKAFTRDLASQMERDLGTGLDWIALDHWNTDNPHVHLLVRGTDETGADLVIARDYISKGLRSRAEELVSIELGPKPEHDVRQALEREVGADRWTRLDVEIRFAADETGYIDLRPAGTGPGDSELRRLMIGRLQKLERMGLAASAGPGEWMVWLEAERKLRDLGMRTDIIKTMHRAFTERGQDRGVSDYMIETDATTAPLIGKLIDKGLHDELSGEAYVVIDGTDGRAHHLRFRDLAALDHSPPLGGVVEIRRFGGPGDENPTMVLVPRSDLDLDAQVTAKGATWLDHRLVEREPLSLSEGGFGAEVRRAMAARTGHLIEEGLGRRQAQRIVFQRDLLSTLRQRELSEVGGKLASQTGLSYSHAEAGESVTGVYWQSLSLASGRFAMIEDGLGFQLVPWSLSLERNLGRYVSGVAKDDGGIEWSLERKRGLGL